MKLPTIILGIPQVSRRMVNEKQQLTKPSSLGDSCGLFDPRELAVIGATPGIVISGLKRRTHEVRTAFCVESNATWPYF